MPGSGTAAGEGGGFASKATKPPMSAKLVALSSFTSEMYAALILLAAVAYVLNQLFILWEARAIHWARTREAAWSEQ